VPASDLVVVGRITKVAKGIGFEGHRDAAGTAVTVPFDDPAAKWKTLHLDVQVSKQWGEPLDRGRPLRVALSFYPDEDIGKFEAGLRSLGKVVLFLKSPVAAYEESLLGILMNGGMVAAVGEDGELSLPFLKSDDAEQYLKGVETLDKLERAANGPERVVPVERDRASVTQQS
jgi:hypothetical protein